MSKARLILFFGLATVIIPLAAVALSYSLLPEKFYIPDHWVSDLGNSVNNPRGAVFFNYGCVLTALFYLLLNSALSEVKTNSRKRKNLLAASELFGISSAYAMIGVSIFPGGQKTSTHYLFAGAVVFFACAFFMGTVNALKKFNIVRNSDILMLLFTIFLVCAAAVVLFRFLICEWIALGMILAYILYFSIVMARYLRNKKTM